MRSNESGDAERQRIASFVGTRENAAHLFDAKVNAEDLKWAGECVLSRLAFVDGVNSVYSNFTCLSDSDVPEWATRCWANTVAHLCTVDDVVRATVVAHQSSLPNDTAAQQLLIDKVYSAFAFFLWIVAGPTKPLTKDNVCVVKLVVLRDVVLLEEIQATREGSPGGWALMDKTIAGLRDVGRGFWDQPDQSDRNE